MPNGIGRVHWLVDVGVAAGVPELELSTTPDFQAVRSAWERVAVALGVGEEIFAGRVAAHFRIPVADLGSVERRALSLVPRDVAITLGVVPLRVEDDALVVATADPGSSAARQRLTGASGREVRFEVAGPRALEAALAQHYSERRYVDATLRELLADISGQEPMVVRSGGSAMLAGLPTENPAVSELLRRILHYAAGRGATDIHLEPHQGAGRVRLRVDGVMQQLLSCPAAALERVQERVRSLAELDPWDATPGQEGTVREVIQGRNWELRVRTGALPDGRKLVIRLLDLDTPRTLDGLGYPEPEARQLRELASHRDGIILLSGPARSGITTLFYGILGELATAERNVASLENPVEANLPGVNQTPFDRNRWPGYHVALQEVLHQDADVIGAGELRDLHTARIAVRAGVTGHLVVATLHTQDAIGALQRLRDLGVDAGRIAESVRGSVSQRLVRRLCPACSRPVSRREDLPEREQELARVFGAVPARVPVGCPACGNTGYRGQLPCPEVVILNDSLRSLLLAGAPVQALEAAAAAGTRPMLHVALDRAERGETTLTEVARIFGDDPVAAPEEPGPLPVLVVDDDPADRLLVRAVLERQRIPVVEASGGEEALRLLEEGQEFAAMVLDLRMPGLPGAEVLRRLRLSFRTWALPVVVLTSSGEVDDEVSLLESGADDFVRKPVDPRRLAARLRAVTRRGAAPIRGSVA